MTIKGDLQDMSLRDLILFFRMGSKSGILGLANQNESGMVYVVDGRMIDAIIVRSCDSTVMAVGNEAAMQIFLWKEARFAFRQDATASDHPVRINCDEEWLEREAQRRRECVTTEPFAPAMTLDATLELVALPDNDQSKVSLTMNQWRIISLIPNLHTLDAICRRVPIEPETAICAANQLVELGLIQISYTAATSSGTMHPNRLASYARTLAA